MADLVNSTESSGIRINPSVLFLVEQKYFILPRRLFNIRSATPRRGVIVGGWLSAILKEADWCRGCLQESSSNQGNKFSWKGTSEVYHTSTIVQWRVSLSPPVWRTSTCFIPTTQNNQHTSWLCTVDSEKGSFLPRVPPNPCLPGPTLPVGCCPDFPVQLF